MNGKKQCFVCMPFMKELNFFYLYLQKHLEEKHGLSVERGDQRILSRPIIDKINEMIRSADVIIADITGANPNVFFELGLCYAQNKEVILITQDSAEGAPTDVRHLEFINYDLGRHDEFLARIDNAIHNVFVDRYRSLHEEALQLLSSFENQVGKWHERASDAEFFARVRQAEATQHIPTGSPGAKAEFLLPKIVKNPSDVGFMRTLMQWLDRDDGEQDPRSVQPPSASSPMGQVGQ
jgi:hypothetical protein